MHQIWRIVKLMNATAKNIINIANILFVENGYEKVSVEEICRKCDITKTAFYYHFSSKEDILFHMYDPITENLVNELIALLDIDNSWDQLMTCFEYLVDEGSKFGPDISSQLLISNLKKDRGSYDLRPDLTKLAIKLIEKAQKDGLIRNTSPAADLYEASAYAFLGYEVTWCIKNGNFDRKKEVRKAMENLYDVIPSLRLK